MAAGMSCVGQSNMTQLYMEVVDMDFLNFASLKEAAAFTKARVKCSFYDSSQINRS